MICPEGDLILRISRNGSTDLALVSSRKLNSTTQTFARLLRNGEDSRRQQKTATMELDLTEDNGDAVLMVCNIVHGHTGSIPDELPLHRIQAMATFCIKFELLEAVACYSTKWLKHANYNANEKTQRSISAIAKSLDITSDFIYEPQLTHPARWNCAGIVGSTFLRTSADHSRWL